MNTDLIRQMAEMPAEQQAVLARILDGVLRLAELPEAEIQQRLREIGGAPRIPQMESAESDPEAAAEDATVMELTGDADADADEPEMPDALTWALDRLYVGKVQPIILGGE